MVAGQPPNPNAVTVSVSVDGNISFYNNAGTVDIAVDIVGYYEPSSTGPAGPKGDTGLQGPSGVTPAQVVWVAKSGGKRVGLARQRRVKGADGAGEFFGKVGTLLTHTKFEMAPIAAEGDTVVAMGDSEAPEEAGR